MAASQVACATSYVRWQQEFLTAKFGWESRYYGPSTSAISAGYGILITSRNKMTRSGGFITYQGFMADWAASAIAPNGELLHGDKRSANDLQTIDDIFKRFTEITETVENLDLCLSFISGRPPRRNGLRLDVFLNYHITFYLQEIYILNGRLDAYIKVLQRRKKKLGEGIDNVKYSYWIKRVRSALKDIIDVRGAHVHDRAFSDSKMKELSSYSFLAIHAPEKAIWEKLAKKEYAKIRRTWVTALQTNKLELQTLLDEYFEFVHSEVSTSALADPPVADFNVQYPSRP